MDQWAPGTHGGTYGGNPIACAASLAVIELLEGGLLDNAVAMGQYFMDQLKGLTSSFAAIKDIRGLGVMIGMELMTKDGEPDAQSVTMLKDKALEKGLILLTCGTERNVIRFMPSTAVSKAEIDQAMAIIREALTEIFG
jgi:4-aminobutyrate aminotransferase